MKATIKYNLSEIGRKASLIAGGDGKAEQNLECDVDISALDVLNVKSDGSIVGDATKRPGDYGGTSMRFDSPQTAEQLLANLRLWQGEVNAQTAKRAAEEAAQKEAEIIELEQLAALEAEFFANPAERATQPLGYRYNWKYQDHDTNKWSNAFINEAKRRERADKAACEAEREAKKAKREAEQKMFFDTWLTEHGTENQRERFVAGLLSEQEIKATIRDHIFATIEAEQYVKIKHSECCTDECGACYDDCKMSCSVDEPESLDAEEWESVKRLRALVSAALPEATTEIRLHSCTVTCCDGNAIRLGLLATVTLCGMEFNREFAI